VFALGWEGKMQFALTNCPYSIPPMLKPRECSLRVVGKDFSLFPPDPDKIEEEKKEETDERRAGGCNA
jgi:hypothetical protein